MTHEADKGGANHIQTFVLVMLSEPTEEEKTKIQKQQPKIISSLVLLSKVLITAIALFVLLTICTIVLVPNRERSTLRLYVVTLLI